MTTLSCPQSASGSSSNGSRSSSSSSSPFASCRCTGAMVNDPLPPPPWTPLPPKPSVAAERLAAAGVASTPSKKESAMPMSRPGRREGVDVVFGAMGSAAPLIRAVLGAHWAGVVPGGGSRRGAAAGIAL